MEGASAPEAMDRVDIPDRFKLMAGCDFANPLRRTGNWYPALPPLVQQNSGLTPMDYFGRVMVEYLPADVRVGVVPVAIGGCGITHLSKSFDPNFAATNSDRGFSDNFARYDNHPYSRLITLAKEAQKQGVIKGILFQQGEYDNGDPKWGENVKIFYNDVLTDLGLNAEDVPLFAGEVVPVGPCAAHNAAVNALPELIPTAHVISSADCPAKPGDEIHFSAAGYRIIGGRYAQAALKVLDNNSNVTDADVKLLFVKNILAYGKKLPRHC